MMAIFASILSVAEDPLSSTQQKQSGQWHDWFQSKDVADHHWDMCSGPAHRIDAI